MLGGTAFAAYAARLGLERRAVDVVARARQSQPLAGTSLGHGSMTGRFASAKMGHSIGADARTTEFMAFLDYELDDNVHEFWEQAVELVVRFEDRSGRRRAVRTRIDVLVLERDGVFLDSWKTEEELLELVASQPGIYARDKQRWRSMASEQAAAELGLRFRLRTPASLRPEIVQNGTFLRTFWQSKRAVPSYDLEALLATVDAHPGLTVAELLREQSHVPADHLYLAIARGNLYVDLARHKLADPFQTPVFRSRALALAASERADVLPATSRSTDSLHPGATVDLAGSSMTVLAVSELSVRLRNEGGGIVELARAEAERRIAATADEPLASRSGYRRLLAASPKALAIAERRLAVVRAHAAGDPLGVSPRTARRWAQRFREAEHTSNLGLLGLVPGPVGRPRGPSLHPDLEAIMARLIQERFERGDAPTKQLLHADIVIAARAAGLTPPSYATVLSRLQGRDTHETVRRQDGQKAAYQVRDWTFYLAHDTPRHGDRPWERAHLDHTLIDVVLADSETGLPLGRPWLTLLIDAYSRRVLSYWMTFDPPSAVSAVMALRRCVERWERLPDEIVVDDGAEFNSAWFEQFLAAHRVHKLTRRGDPMSGSVVERIFGTLNTRLWHRLQGQTRPTKNIRSMSPEVDPQRRAIWTLASISVVLEQFLFELYDTTVHPAFGQTPRDVYATRIALTGERAEARVAYDQAFYFLTLPSTRKGHAKATYAKGIRINGRHYLAAELRTPSVAGSSVPVRWDPMDARRAYAFVLGRWVELYCPSLRRFPAVSAVEVAAISAEYDERRRRTGATRGPASEALSTFLADAQTKSATLLAARRDRAAREAGHATTPPGEPATTAPLRRPKSATSSGQSAAAHGAVPIPPERPADAMNDRLEEFGAY